MYFGKEEDFPIPKRNDEDEENDFDLDDDDDENEQIASLLKNKIKN